MLPQHLQYISHTNLTPSDALFSKTISPFIKRNTAVITNSLEFDDHIFFQSDHIQNFDNKLAPSVQPLTRSQRLKHAHRIAYNRDIPHINCNIYLKTSLIENASKEKFEQSPLGQRKQRGGFQSLNRRFILYNQKKM